MATPPRQRRGQPRSEVPSAIQLDLKPSKALLRGLFGRCPICGDRHVFANWFKMKERCPTCSFYFERVDGHWIGAIGTNTVCVMGLMLIVLGVVTFATFPESPAIIPILSVEIIIAVLGPILFFPPSRTLWSAIDLLMVPLWPGEVDPRFIKVDPERDGIESPHSPEAKRRRAMQGRPAPKKRTPKASRWTAPPDQR